MNQNDNQVSLILLVALLFVLIVRRRWKPSTTAFGTSRWATEAIVESAGMLGSIGLIIGRTMRGKLLRLRNYCHILMVGATGSGKGLIIIPILFTYFQGSVVCVDVKGDLHATCGNRRRSRGERIIRLAPFNGGEDCLNPLDAIAEDSPLLIDSARALAESLVVRQGSELDSHWNDKAVQVICAILVLILMRFEGEERSLNSLQEIASSPSVISVTADKLIEMEGIPARLGQQLKALFDHDDVLTKEGSSVMSTVARHLAFLDSEMVARSVARSTFDPAILLKPGTTLFLQIPPDQLEAQRGLLRCWLSTLVRAIGAAGDERKAETLFIIDEASALGSLSAIEESLVRGRSAGIRLLLAYQSDSQVQTAFKGKQTLLYDNCSTHIYLGASSIETAERLAKSLGDWTQVLEAYSENYSRSWSSDASSSNRGQQVSKASSLSYSVSGRPLLRPDEILRLSDNLLIVLCRGMPPILARKIRWYLDATFNPNVRVQRAMYWLVIVVVAIAALWLANGGCSFASSQRE